VALAAGVAFADVGIGSWGRAIFSPVGTLDGGKTFVSNETTSWMGGAGTSRMGFSVHGESENVGFNVDLKADGYSVLGINDTAYFWAKPWSFLEVKIGKVQDDTGRGNLCYGMFNWWRMGFGFTGEDLTFTRFGNGGGGQAQGATVKITPVEGLWIIGAFDLVQHFGDWERPASTDAAKVFGNYSQYGVGYDINGVGSVRAQYIGQANATDKKGDTIWNGKAEVAFDLTAVEGLYVTVGAQIPFAFNAVDVTGTSATVSNQVKIAAGADFKLAAVTLHAIADVRLPNTVDLEGNASVTKGGRVGVGVGADVDFGNNIVLVADVRFNSAQDKVEKADDATVTTIAEQSTLSFLVGLQKGLTNGMIGVGFEGEVQKITTSDSQFNWAIPVVISAWF
ncbi:MAG: hypothetical protein ACI4LX_11485, partial [Treponema sp.]